LKGVKLVQRESNNGKKTTQVSTMIVGNINTHGPLRNFFI
jgi:hypothetical protein